MKVTSIIFLSILSYAYTFSTFKNSIYNSGKIRLNRSNNFRVPTGLKYSFLDQLSVTVYDTQLDISNNLLAAFSNPSPLSAVILASAGFLSSLSPCCLSMVPLTTIYLSNAGKDQLDSTTNKEAVMRFKSLLYAAGLSFTYTLLGLGAALTGKIFSPDENISGITSLLTAMFSIAMGLNLLELVNIQFPTIDFSEQRKQLNLPWQVEPFVFGATAALVFSPCSSPVLASLLALVGTSQNPTLGAFYLFLFSLGYSLPTVYAVNSSINFVQSKTISNFTWVNSVFGGLLLTFGTYFVLDSTTKLIFGI